MSQDSEGTMNSLDQLIQKYMWKLTVLIFMT